VQISLSIPSSFFGLATFSWFQQTMQTPCEVWPQFFTTCSENDMQREIKGSWNHWNPSVPKLSRVLTINHLGIFIIIVHNNI
jgi:hypothetical protein